jgi:hypothetical protein
MTTNKLIYWELIKKIQITPIIKDKWKLEFGLTEDNWENIFNVAKVIRDTKIRTFQYKLIFRLTPCNLYLFKIGKIDSHTCHYCNLVDNLGHHFYDCQETKNFWNALQNWWNSMEGEQITLNKEQAIIGTDQGIILEDKLGACLQLARWHIYCEKLNIKSPSLYKYLCMLKYKIKIEKSICLGNNQTALFEKRWQEIEGHLD